MIVDLLRNDLGRVCEVNYHYTVGPIAVAVISANGRPAVQ